MKMSTCAVSVMVAAMFATAAAQLNVVTTVSNEPPKQFAMDYTTAKKSAACLLEIRDNYLRLEPYQHTHVAEFFPQYLGKYECVQELAKTTGLDRRGRGLLYNIGKRLGLTRWGQPGNRFRDWMVSRFTASPARNNDYSCGDLPAAECVAAGFMYKCLGCCLGSEQSALQSGCCNVCLFKVLLFGDDPSLGSIPVEVVEQQFHVTEDGKAAPGDKNDNPKPSFVPSSSSLSSSASATGDSSSLAQLLPTKIGHTEATLAAADMMITLDEKPLSPEQIKELEQKRRREKAELEQISNIQKFLRDNYKPSYLPDVEENDPSTKHTKFNLRPARTKKELADAKGVSKTAQKVYVWNGKDFDAAIIEVNGELTDHGKIVEDDNNPKPDAPEARQGTDISWTGNGKLGFPDDNDDEVPEPVAAALQPVLVWTGNGKLEADLVVNPVQQRSNSRHLRFLD